MKPKLLARTVAVALIAVFTGFGASASTKPNILFIAIDDYRDWAGYLGNNQAKTPNLDRLAAMGESFSRSYCASPSCNPSRTALLTGLRPSTTGVYTNTIDWRKNPVAQSVPTLPVYFRDNGYVAYAAGKIYHESQREPDEWDGYADLLQLKNPPSNVEDRRIKGLPFRPLTISDQEMPDYATVSYCIEQLEKAHDKPLLLGCGIYKPHLPWEVPQKYFDLHPLESIEVPEVLEGDLDDVPPVGVEIARLGSAHEQIVREGRWKEAVQAYLASISFADAMLGRLLDALEKSAYKDDMVIVLWSDHGWHLGEKEHWKKFTLWEESTRSPMIWVVPGVTKPGSVCARTVDFMSIYPTLCELAGIPIPNHVEGKSLVPLLKDPQAPWSDPAVATHNFNNHSVRSERWRYIRYHDGTEELYDHDQDPNEWHNLAANPEYAEVKAELIEWIPKTNVPMPVVKGGKAAKDND